MYVVHVMHLSLGAGIHGRLGAMLGDSMTEDWRDEAPQERHSLRSPLLVGYEICVDIVKYQPPECELVSSD